MVEIWGLMVCKPCLKGQKVQSGKAPFLHTHGAKKIVLHAELQWEREGRREGGCRRDTERQGKGQQEQDLSRAGPPLWPAFVTGIF